MPKKARPKMSDSHKSAIARGREMSRAVDEYLTALHTPKPRGRQISREELEHRLAEREAEVASAKGVAKLRLVKEIEDLSRRLDEKSGPSQDDLDALEERFVDVAAEFSDVHGYTYSMWREVGVPAATLKKAGVSRSR